MNLQTEEQLQEFETRKELQELVKAWRALQGFPRQGQKDDGALLNETENHLLAAKKWQKRFEKLANDVEKRLKKERDAPEEQEIAGTEGTLISWARGFRK